jgi:alpha-L-rhamnosidase
MRGMNILLALAVGAARLSSVSQGALAAPEQLRCEGLAGIRCDEKAPGFQHFIAAPGVESGLKRVDASLTTGYGKIVSAWRVDGNTLTWDLAVPPNTTATVVIPAVGLGTVRESGRPVESQPGIAHPTVAKGLFRCDVASGAYRFTGQLPPK